MKKEDEVLAEKVRNKPHFVVLNKSDIFPQLNKARRFLALSRGGDFVEVSALQGERG